MIPRPSRPLTHASSTSCSASDAWSPRSATTSPSGPPRKAVDWCCGQRVLGRDRHDFAVEHRPVTAPINQEPQSTGRPDSDHRTESEGNQHGGHHRLRRSPAQHLQDVDTETLDALTAAAKTAARSRDVDLQDGDIAEGIDLSGADLSG